MLGSVIIGVGTGSSAALTALIAGGSWMDAFALYVIVGICGLLGWALVQIYMNYKAIDNTEFATETRQTL